MPLYFDSDLLHEVECEIFHCGVTWTLKVSHFGAFHTSNFHVKDPQPFVIVFSVFVLTQLATVCTSNLFQSCVYTRHETGALITHFILSGF